jgi:hypothetical protein
MTAATKEIELTFANKQKKAGSAQSAIKGKTIDQLILNKQEGQLTRPDLLRGILAIGTFGMYDAHASNIMVDKNSRISFFDNARSLPNSNDYVLWGTKGGQILLPSIRCGLLKLQSCHEPLTQDEKDLMLLELRKIQEKSIRSFFESPYTQNDLKKLAPGWIDQESVVSAAEERIQKAINALESDEVKTPADLIFAFNPENRFVATLSTIVSMHSKFSQSSVIPTKWNDALKSEKGRELVRSGLDKGYDLANLMELVTRLGYDTAQLHALCLDSTHSFDDLVDKISGELLPKTFKSFTVDEFEEKYKVTEDLLKYLETKAKSEPKDTQDLRINPAIWFAEELIKYEILTEIRRTKDVSRGEMKEMVENDGFCLTINTNNESLRLVLESDGSYKKYQLWWDTGAAQVTLIDEEKRETTILSDDLIGYLNCQKREQFYTGHPIEIELRKNKFKIYQVGSDLDEESLNSKVIKNGYCLCRNPAGDLLLYLPASSTTNEIKGFALHYSPITNHVELYDLVSMDGYAEGDINDLPNVIEANLNDLWDRKEEKEIPFFSLLEDYQIYGTLIDNPDKKDKEILNTLNVHDYCLWTEKGDSPDSFILDLMNGESNTHQRYKVTYNETNDTVHVVNQTDTDITFPSSEEFADWLFLQIGESEDDD